MVVLYFVSWEAPSNNNCPKDATPIHRLFMKRTIDCARRLFHTEPNVEIVLCSTTVS